MSFLEDEFGDIIRKARVGLGLSREQVAEDVGVSPQVIAAFEAYERSPSQAESDAIAARLRLNAKALWDVACGAYSPRRMTAPLGLEILSFTFPGMDSKGYALRWKDSGVTLFVDPGGDAGEIVQALDERNWTLDAILVTHGHSDHVAGLEGVRERFPVPVYASRHEWKGDGLVDVSDKGSVEIRGVVVQVIHCPGHTPHGVTFAAGGVAAVGDTLFAGSLGGPYQGPAYYGKLLESAAKILSLPDDTVLLPGHGPATTVAAEKVHNAFMAGRTPA